MSFARYPGKVDHCELWKRNTNKHNFCSDKCYQVDYNSKWLKQRVRPTDHAAFSVQNRISGGDTQYFGGEYNVLHYSRYTPYQFDPTWEEPNVTWRFPNSHNSGGSYGSRFQ